MGRSWPLGSPNLLDRKKNSWNKKKKITHKLHRESVWINIHMIIGIQPRWTQHDSYMNILHHILMFGPNKPRIEGF